MIKITIPLIVLVLLYSCATNLKFPTSSVVPAATISAKKKMDVQKNYTLEIKAKNLASSERLDPPGNNYSIWIVSKEYGIKNIGQLHVENGKKTKYKTITPFDFDEVFITVEDQGNLQRPRGIEITRKKF